MSKSTLLLVATCGLLSACSSYNVADYSGPKYVPRPAVPAAEYDAKEAYEDHIDRMKYNRYEEREECQNYRQLPRNSVETRNCVAVKAAPPPPPSAPVPPPAPVAEMVPPPPPAPLMPIIHTYTVLFDLNHSNIRANQMTTLDQVANEINQYKPEQITVTGFTDTSGTASYNEALSEKRAHSVTNALKERNISSQEVDQKARGETDLAVPTADGVKLQENRRVVVDFRARPQ